MYLDSLRMTVRLRALARHMKTDPLVQQSFERTVALTRSLEEEVKIRKERREYWESLL